MRIGTKKYTYLCNRCWPDRDSISGHAEKLHLISMYIHISLTHNIATPRGPLRSRRRSRVKIRSTTVACASSWTSTDAFFTRCANEFDFSELSRAAERGSSVVLSPTLRTRSYLRFFSRSPARSRDNDEMSNSREVARARARTRTVLRKKKSKPRDSG